MFVVAMVMIIPVIAARVGTIMCIERFDVRSEFHVLNTHTAAVNTYGGAVSSSVWIVLKPKLRTRVGKKLVSEATAWTQIYDVSVRIESKVGKSD